MVTEIKCNINGSKGARERGALVGFGHRCSCHFSGTAIWECFILIIFVLKNDVFFLGGELKSLRYFVASPRKPLCCVQPNCMFEIVLVRKAHS